MTTPPTEQQLDEIETRAAHLYEYGVLDDQPFQADLDQLTGTDVPALTAALRDSRAEIDKLIRWHGEDETAMKRMRATISRLRAERAAVAPDAASVPPGAPVRPVHASSVSESAQSPTGAATGRLGDLPSTEDLAAADNPTHLRWGLNDVLWSDDDSVIVLLSGPDLEAYWLELDPERAAVLREDLAGPPAEETHIVADDSSDPEHVDDCPGCTTAPQPTS